MKAASFLFVLFSLLFFPFLFLPQNPRFYTLVLLTRDQIASGRITHIPPRGLSSFVLV